LTNTYAKGKINEQQHTNLKDEISILYHEIYKKRNDSLNGSVPVDKIKDDIENAYAKGMISEQHYKLLVGTNYHQGSKVQLKAINESKPSCKPAREQNEI
jgi:uncharacterized membrane protein